MFLRFLRHVRRLRLTSFSVLTCALCLSLLLPLPSAAPVLAAGEPSLQPIPVGNLNPNGDAYPSLPTVIDDTLYFVANNGQSPQLFRTSGTSAVQISDVYAGTSGLGCIMAHRMVEPIRQGSLILFGADPAGTCWASEVWATTGTAAGAQLVKQFNGTISTWRTLGDRTLIFAYGDNQGGLWQTDGTAAGTTLIKDGFTFDERFVPQVMGGALYFAAKHAETGVTLHLWRATLTDVVPLDVDMYMANMMQVYDDALYLSLSNRVVRLPAGSDTAADFHRDVLRPVAQMQVVGDRLYLMNLTYARGRTENWWRYDGATDTLEKIAGQWGRVTGLTQMGDSVYFSGYPIGDPTADGSELVRLPLTSTTPISISPVFTVTGTQDIGAIVTDGSLLYLLVNPRMIDSLPPTELWVSDGTAAGTRKVAEMAATFENTDYAGCPCITLAGGRLYFDRQMPGSGVELWTLAALAPPKVFVYLPQVTH